MSLPEIAGHELQDLIGSGSCGAVYRASAGGKVCAVKVFSSMAINRKALSAAMQALRQLPHHACVLPVEHFNFERSPYFLATPLVGTPAKDSHGRRVWQTVTLESLCSGCPPERAWGVIYQIADALAWLHKHGIPHGNLRPCNILLEDDAAASIRLTDVGQGWVGGIHHLELTDHFIHLCPEQAENPDGVFAGYGPGWDVYAFGVIAWRLLTGRLPRAGAAWAAQVEQANQKAAAGLAYGIDSPALLAAVRAQAKVSWPDSPTSKWDERRRHIIERCLDLNSSARWADMREVVREFELLESDYLLEEAREQTVHERKKQARNVLALQTAGLALLTLLIICGAYAFLTLRRARDAETVIGQKDAILQQEKDIRDARITALIQERDTALAAKQTADLNLRHAQLGVDKFLTQLLQTPTGNQLEVEFSKARLNEALEYCTSTLPDLEADPALGIERLRAYGNIGRIHLQLRQHERASEYLEKAREQSAALLSAAPASPQAPLYHQWLGRYSLLLSDLHQRRGDRASSLTLLQDATRHLTDGLAADPGNRLALNECARAWMEYGQRNLQNGDLTEAGKALTRVPDILDPKLLGEKPLPAESFLLARATFAKGLVQRDSGHTQDALDTLIEAVTEMGRLVIGSSPRNQDQALLLAEAYTELSELISKSIGAKEAREAHDQAVPILLELNRLHPEWADVKYLIARNYGAISLLERDLGNNNEASKKKQDAIELINEVVADEPGNLRYAALQARLRGEYAELMSDLGKPTAALPILTQAVQSMEELLARDSAARLTPERKEQEIQLAHMQGVLGHTLQSLKKPAEAKTAFTSAVTRWEKLSALIPGDEVIQQGHAWAKDRLAKLK